VLINLLDNALKYSPPGSPIDVEARISDRSLERSCLIAATVCLRRSRAHLDQSSPGRRPAGSQRHGIGTGNLQRHRRGAPAAVIWRRTVWAAERWLRGAVLRQDATTGVRAMGESGQRVAVDDEPAIRRFLRTSLSAHGYTRVRSGQTVRRGYPASPCIGPKPGHPRSGLPDIDGIEVMRRLREWSQFRPHRDVQEQESSKIGVDAGADDYVTKPFRDGRVVDARRLSPGRLTGSRAGLRHRGPHHGPGATFGEPLTGKSHSSPRPNTICCGCW